MDELLARATLALPVLVRAKERVRRVMRAPRSSEAFRAAWLLRRAAEELQNAADALEEFAEYSKFREERFGRRGVRF